MNKQFYARGMMDTKLDGTFLYIPQDKKFNIPPSQYVLEKGQVNDYKLLTLFPEDTWKRELANRRRIGIKFGTAYMSRTEKLKAVMDGGRTRLDLPVDFLLYIMAVSDSTLRIVGCVDDLEIWNISTFDKFNTEKSLDEVLVPLAL